MTTNTSLLERRKVLGTAYRLFYEQPVHLVRGEGVWLEDIDGKRYLDMYNNVPVVGHANPAVVQAMTQQASILNTHTRYLHENVVAYAEQLLALFPKELNRAVFTCTGSEANDLALRIAHEVTGRRGVIVTQNAYHGVTSLLADMSPSLRPVAEHVEVVPAPTSLQGSATEIASEFAALVDAAAQRLAAKGVPVCALMVDTVFASDGLYLPSQGVLAAAAKVVRQHGGLFIADEVQGGFARVGGQWWAFQQDDVIPDMVTLGKPMGNGHPIGAVVVREQWLHDFGTRCRYFNTFGGNTVSAAVGLAVLHELHKLNATQHVQQVGNDLGQHLHALSTHELVQAVRGSGLYWSITLQGNDTHTASELAVLLVNGLRQEGILIGTCGQKNDALKIRPPLVFAKEHVSLFMEVLQQQLQQINVVN